MGCNGPSLTIRRLAKANRWSGRREISRGTILSRFADRLSAVSQAFGDGLYGGWCLVSEVEGMVHG